MSKSSQELYTNKLKNPVYCEILYKINYKEVYISDFIKQFNKSREALYQQVNELETEGYLKTRTEGRKVFFTVNWEGLNIKFLDFLRYEEKKLLKLREYAAFFTKPFDQEEKEFFERLRKNKYLTILFQNFLLECFKLDNPPTIHDLFSLFVTRPETMQSAENSFFNKINAVILYNTDRDKLENIFKEGEIYNNVQFLKFLINKNDRLKETELGYSRKTIFKDIDFKDYSFLLTILYNRRDKIKWPILDKIFEIQLKEFESSIDKGVKKQFEEVQTKTDNEQIKMIFKHIFVE